MTGRRRHGWHGFAVPLTIVLAAMLAACGGAQQPSTGTPDREAAAGRVLAGVQRKAAEKQQPVVAISHADWCAPCNDLEMHVLATAQGQELLRDTIPLSIDFDNDIGAAVSARLHVLGLPTTIVLRVEGDRLVEYGRIEGYEDAATWRQSVQVLLERKTPLTVGCHNADDRSLSPTGSAATLLPDAECTAARLQTADGADAAEKLRSLFADRRFATTGADWTEDQRARLADVLTLLGRYDARVARRPALCADDFGRLLAWPGIPQNRKPGAVFWQARCLVRADRRQEALGVLDAWLTERRDDPAAERLVADLLVNERFEAQRARRLLNQVVARTPEDDEAWFLLSELDVQEGNPQAALAHLLKAGQLKPRSALYIRRLRRLHTPSATPEPVAPADKSAPAATEGAK